MTHLKTQLICNTHSIHSRPSYQNLVCRSRKTKLCFSPASPPEPFLLQTPEIGCYTTCLYAITEKHAGFLHPALQNKTLPNSFCKAPRNNCETIMQGEASTCWSNPALRNQPWVSDHNQQQRKGQTNFPLKPTQKFIRRGLTQETNEIHVFKSQFEVSTIKVPRAENPGWLIFSP